MPKHAVMSTLDRPVADPLPLAEWEVESLRRYMTMVADAQESGDLFRVTLAASGLVGYLGACLTARGV